MIKKISISQLDKEYLFKNKTQDKRNRTEPKADFTKLVVNKPWGCEYLAYSSPNVEIWHLFIKKLASTSVHCHPNKKTGLILLEGEAIFSTLNESIKLNPLDAIIMDSGVFHSTQAISEGGAHVLETETPPDKYDLIRLQDKYGRVGRGYEGLNAMFPDKENSLRFLNLDSDLVEKDFYNKRIGVQKTSQRVASADIVVILDNTKDFLAGDIIRGSELLDKAEHELTVMFIKVAL